MLRFINVKQILINVELKKADIFPVSDKLVITRLSRTKWTIFSSFLIFCFYFTRLNKSAKYEKLGKYWSYCTRNRAITNAYFNIFVHFYSVFFIAQSFIVEMDEANKSLLLYYYYYCYYYYYYYYYFY